MVKWSRILGELLYHRAAAQRTWGDLDEALVAKYISGLCDESERSRVEQLVESNAEVRELVATARDACENIVLAPSSSPRSLAEVVWAGPAALQKLAGSLRAWLDASGRVASSGFQEFAFRPAPVFGALGPAAAGESQRVEWTLPLADPEAEVLVAAYPGEPVGSWRIRLELRTAAGADLAERTRVEIRDENGRMEFSGRLTDCSVEPVDLDSGQWQLVITVGEAAWLMPLELGESPPPSDDKGGLNVDQVKRDQ